MNRGMSISIEDAGDPSFAARLLAPVGYQIIPQLCPETVLKPAGILDGRCQCATASIWF